MRFNRGQAEAIQHGEGPCMVLAPPGSGKTLIITQRIKYLIEKKKVSPEEILVITFTRYAAREMRERFERISDIKANPVTFGTFHSIFYGILKHTYGITGKNLLPELDGLRILKEALNEVYIETIPDVEDEDELTLELMREIGMVKNGLYRLADFKSSYLTNEEFTEVFRAYEHKKKALHKFDFDDVLVQCYALFQKRKDILANWQSRFKYILIDEFQDINRVQYEVIRMLAQKDRNLFVVGDDDQSIYGFRGASPELMLYMKQEYPDMRTISLNVNYRSTEYIVGAATRVILHNDKRFFKRVKSNRGVGKSVHIQELKDEMEEAAYIAENIRKELDAGRRPEQISVLYRAGIQARMITEIMSEHRIPFYMKEHIPNFYDHFIPRDMISYFKLAMGKRDRYLFLHVGNRPLRYISRTCLDEPQISFEDLRKLYADKEWMQDIIDQFDVDIRMMENMAPYAAIQYIRKRIGYDEFLKKYAVEHNIPYTQLEAVFTELEERCKTYRTFSEFIEHVENYGEELKANEKDSRYANGSSKGKVQLMTMHAAKGLEFEKVFIIHANEGETPYQKAESKDELEEERRMFYVAMTRAKDELTISYIIDKNGKKCESSRFVKEILGKTS